MFFFWTKQNKNFEQDPKIKPGKRVRKILPKNSKNTVKSPLPGGMGGVLWYLGFGGREIDRCSGLPRFPPRHALFGFNRGVVNGNLLFLYLSKPDTDSM